MQEILVSAQYWAASSEQSRSRGAEAFGWIDKDFKLSVQLSDPVLRYVLFGLKEAISICSSNEDTLRYRVQSKKEEYLRNNDSTKELKEFLSTMA